MYGFLFQEHEKNDAETLGLPNLGGVFIVLGGGVAAAILIAKLELFVFLWSESQEKNVSLARYFTRESLPDFHPGADPELSLAGYLFLRTKKTLRIAT